MKRISNMFVGVAVVFFTWFVVSFINMNMCNDPFSKNYRNYASWNLISIIVESSQNVN